MRWLKCKKHARTATDIYNFCSVRSNDEAFINTQPCEDNWSMRTTVEQNLMHYMIIKAFKRKFELWWGNIEATAKFKPICTKAEFSIVYKKYTENITMEHSFNCGVFGDLNTNRCKAEKLQSIVIYVRGNIYLKTDRSCIL